MLATKIKSLWIWLKLHISCFYLSFAQLQTFYICQNWSPSIHHFLCAESESRPTSVCSCWRRKNTSCRCWWQSPWRGTGSRPSSSSHTWTPWTDVCAWSEFILAIPTIFNNFTPAEFCFTHNLTPPCILHTKRRACPLLSHPHWVY